MIHKVVIRDNKRSAVKYIANLDNFKNGKEYEFNACLDKYPERYIELTDQDGCTIYNNH